GAGIVTFGGHARESIGDPIGAAGADLETPRRCDTTYKCHTTGCYPADQIKTEVAPISHSAPPVVNAPTVCRRLWFDLDYDANVRGNRSSLWKMPFTQNPIYVWRF